MSCHGKDTCKTPGEGSQARSPTTAPPAGSLELGAHSMATDRGKLRLKISDEDKSTGHPPAWLHE